MGALFLTGVVLYVVGSLMERGDRRRQNEERWLPEDGQLPADLLAYRSSPVTLRGCLWSFIVLSFITLWVLDELSR